MDDPATFGLQVDGYPMGQPATSGLLVDNYPMDDSARPGLQVDSYPMDDLPKCDCKWIVTPWMIQPIWFVSGYLPCE